MARILVFFSKVKKKIKSLLKNLLNSVDGANEVTVEVENTEQPAEVPETQPETIKVTVLSDDNNNFSFDELEKMLKEVLSSKKTSKKKPKTPYVLTIEEPEWFYDPVNRQMIRVYPGIELVMSSDVPDNDGRVMCYCDLGFIMVPLENISEIGCN